MDTEGINHPLLEQLNLSCKYSVERRSVASCYQGSKSSRSQQSLSLDCSAKKKTWISSTSFGQVALSFCLPRTTTYSSKKIREITIIIISLLNPLVVYITKIQGRSRIRRTHNYTWHRRQKQFNPIVTVGNKIPKAVRSDKAEFRTGNWGEQGCLSMLGINHSTHRTSITFCHKLLVNKFLNLPYQETRAATGFSVPVTQPSQTF